MNQEKRKYNNHIIVNYSVSYNSRNVIHITYDVLHMPSK